MNHVVRPCGEHAVLVDVDDDAERASLVRSLQQAPVAGVVDVVLGARTVLLVAAPDADLPAVVRTVLGRDVDEVAGPTDAEQVSLAVRYDGEDLAVVADLLGCSEAAVVAAHTGQVWAVAFCGFAPGFAYLVGEDDRPQVPRRPEPRTRVPAGSVGLAGPYSGVYPTASPGGWQVIGRTDAAIWDLERDPPALLRPGVRVIFEAVRG